MKAKSKLLIILIIIIIIFIAGITYSAFKSNANLESSDQNIAKFIFNAKVTDEISLPIIDLKPGVIQAFNFAVTNSSELGTSDVNIDYQMTIKTPHFMPTNINLYQIIDSQEKLILTCDENYDRNLDNEIVCNAPLQTINYLNNTIHNYKLYVDIPVTYNQPIYQNLIDYINIDIKSQQKMEG